MITNFENITCPLSEVEQELIPILIEKFTKHTGKEQSIKAPQIVDYINKIYEGQNKRFTEARLRKISNHIRKKGLLPLIATSDGYYVSYETDIIKSQIESLEERAQAILASANGLRAFLVPEKLKTTLFD